MLDLRVAGQEPADHSDLFSKSFGTLFSDERRQKTRKILNLRKSSRHPGRGESGGGDSPRWRECLKEIIFSRLVAKEDDFNSYFLFLRALMPIFICVISALFGRKCIVLFKGLTENSYVRNMLSPFSATLSPMTAFHVALI